MGNYDGSDKALEEIVRAILGLEKLWKIDLNTIEGLTSRTSYYLSEIVNKGMKEAIKEVI